MPSWLPASAPSSARHSTDVGGGGGAATADGVGIPRGTDEHRPYLRRAAAAPCRPGAARGRAAGTQRRRPVGGRPVGGVGRGRGTLCCCGRGGRRLVGGAVRTDLVYEDGVRLPLELERWLGEPAPVDRELVGRVVPPVLDVGCGPGRHVVALAAAGIPALGLDVAPSAVHLARARGACVLERSVFARVPGAGRWATALLIDGNAGIGGDPEALLARIAALLRPGGS